VRILGISGSLRAGSSNTRLLEGLRDATPPHHDVVLYESLDDLPHFSPERAEALAPPAVSELRAAVAEADAVVIATPEYAGGMPGSLKNALDWLVGSGELYGKPAVVLSAAPAEDRGRGARASLELTLSMQGASVRDSFTVPVPRGQPVRASNALARTLAALLGPDESP
jgi:chromate reductase